MLILTREAGKGQWVQIGDGIQIHVVECKRGKVRLGIVTPKGTTVLRGPEHISRDGKRVPKKE